MEYWDPVSNAYMSKKASSSIPKGNMLEISALTRCKINLNDNLETAPGTDLDPWGDWDPASNPYKNKTRDNAQIGIEKRGRSVEKIDIDLGRHCSKSSEGEPYESNAKPIEETNIWAPVPKWRMNNNIQIHEQEDESPNGY